MQAMFSGGPYDGICLDHNDINLYTSFCPVGIRKFVIMPPRTDWDAVRRGDLGKEGPFTGSCPVYELVHTPGGVEGQFDADGGVFAAAMKEFREGRQPVPQVEFSGQYYKCYRGDPQDIPRLDGCFNVTDEKDRDWVCVAVSKEQGEEGGFAEMLSRLGGKPASQPLRLVTLLCENKDELPRKLSDQID